MTCMAEASSGSMCLHAVLVFEMKITKHFRLQLYFIIKIIRKCIPCDMHENRSNLH